MMADVLAPSVTFFVDSLLVCNIYGCLLLFIDRNVLFIYDYYIEL